MKVASLITSLCCSAGVLFQTGVIAADNENINLIILDPVIVTGQKIDRTQMETVSSVHIISADQLETSARTDNLYDIVDMAPNVTNTGGFNSLAIRGIANSGPTAVNNGAGTIGIFVDNSLLTARSIQNNALSTWDMESIEILRGPQSTTAGRNSLAGQIILKTKDPEFFSNGSAKVSFGQDGSMQTAIAQTGPITDKLAYRLTADYQKTDGHVTNDILNDDDFNRNNTKNFRLKLLYLLDNDGELLLNLSHNKFREHGDDTVDRGLSGRTSRLNFPSTWQTQTDSISLSFTQPINDEFTFESNTGFVTGDFSRTSDFDGSSDTPIDSSLGFPIPTDTAVLNQQTDEYNFNQEFLLRFNNDRVRSVAGLYFAKGEMDDGYETNNLYFLYGGTTPLLLNDTTDPDEEFTTYAIFGDIDFKATDKLTLMAGLRANKENRESSVSSLTERAISYGAFDATIDGILAAAGLASSSESSEQDSFVLLPKLGFNYMWSESLSTGFVVQKGYRPGGVSVNPILGIVKNYDDESTINYEASLRTIINKRFSINANVFYTDWKDQQVAVASAGFPHPLNFVIENAGESHLYGFEVEANLAVNNNWNVYGGIGYTKTEFDEFNVNGNDHAGEEFQFSRNWTSNLASTYHFNSGWFAHGNISYASEGAASTGTPGTELNSFTLVNAKVGYEQDQWGVYLYANNLFDEEYTTQKVNNVTYGNTTYGDPRIVGVVSTISW
ncbi:MAG: hypothetical protein COA90_10750 [Gammaproteobacteria bacterium]|nr:MAG: hypothetical protein COA90_10750 [Gammaproteobacteria bacterium]